MITITSEDTRRFMELAPEYQSRVGRDPLDEAVPLEDIDKDTPPLDDDDDWDLDDDLSDPDFDEDDWDDDLDDDFDDDCS